jgi:(R,R)-butanediol dehydrogenase / meso-butanediol dehydrogenase / diacetyl reductase
LFWIPGKICAHANGDPSSASNRGETMRAVAITGDRNLGVVNISRPVPGAGEVLLDVVYCGICGSDLHMLGMPAGVLPAGHVLGHEFTGVIAGLGPGVGGWSAGERVAVLPMVACGACYACRAGHPNLWEKGIDYAPGIGRQGAYAESVVVPAGMLRRLPATVSDADGALIEPLAVAIRAIRLSGATPQEPVCVLGAGPIGALTVAGLRARGFGRIAVVEPAAGRRAVAERLGVRAVAPGEATARVPSLLGDEPPTTVIDCTGHPSGAPLAIELLPPAGRLIIAGLPDDPAPIDLAAVAVNEIVIRGSLAYADDDFAEALDHIAAGRVPCNQIVTTIAPLDQAPAWFADLTSGATEQVKVLLCPGPTASASV